MLPKVHSLPLQKLLLFFSFMLILQLLSGKESLFAQCTGTVANPSRPISASAFNDTMVVQTTSRPGQYYRVENLSLNKNYVFMSSAVGDYITIRHAYSNAVLGHGVAPFTYAVGDGPDVVNVHINLQSPPCGTSSENRTTSMACTNCPSLPSGVGVGTSDPNARLDVRGEIKLGNSTRPPEAGMVRWNPAENDFEGYNGTDWVSLTRANANTGQWGQVSNANIQENSKLIADDGASDNRFGSSVSISSNYAIVGAFFSNVGINTNQGAAYIFMRNGNTWTQQAKLTASDGAAGDQFGYSVSINGDYALVGARLDNIGANADQGSAYIFLRNGSNWNQLDKLTASDGDVNDFFGNSVSLSGDNAIVGAIGDNIGANNNQGSAYIFNRSGAGWKFQAKLTASDGLAGDFFGNEVSISGNYAIVGAPEDDIDGKVNQGSAYIFMLSGNSWNQQAKLTASSGFEGNDDKFGSAVSINGTYVIVGAPSVDVGANINQGIAYIYVRSGTTWSEQAQLIATDGASGYGFGNSVSINGGYAIVGAANDGIPPNVSRGAAYIFVRDSIFWSQQAKLVASDGGVADLFGLSVCISDTYAIVGAGVDDIGLNYDQGSAYIIRKN